jgi:hypothetical protein
MGLHVLLQVIFQAKRKIQFDRRVFVFFTLPRSFQRENLQPNKSLVVLYFRHPLFRDIPRTGFRFSHPRGNACIFEM